MLERRFRSEKDEELEIMRLSQEQIIRQAESSSIPKEFPVAFSYLTLQYPISIPNDPDLEVKLNFINKQLCGESFGSTLRNYYAIFYGTSIAYARQLKEMGKVNNDETVRLQQLFESEHEKFFSAKQVLLLTSQLDQKGCLNSILDIFVPREIGKKQLLKGYDIEKRIENYFSNPLARTNIRRLSRLPEE